MKKRRSLTLGLLALLAASTHVYAKEIVEHSRTYYAKKTEAHVYKSESGQTMPYRLFVPQGYDPKKRYPLLFCLHGAGSRGNDNLKQLRPCFAGWIDEAIQDKHPCFILMPQCPTGQQWVNTPWKEGSYSFADTPISKPMALAREIVDKVLKEKSIDQSRIYLMGASMGSYGVWNFVTRYPELIAAAIPICGGGDPSMARILKDIPIWAFHGDKDKAVPPSGSQDMVSAIRKAGGSQVNLTMYQGVGHGSYMKAWREPELIDWVFKQKKLDNKAIDSDKK